MYLVVGSPVEHSLSPAMMQAAFRAAGIRARYEAREVPRGSWPAAMVELFAEGIEGMNVTLPHKEGALAGAAESTEVARSIGAANLLIRGEHGWKADNTDGPGFLEWVRELGAEELLDREAVVLGAGGAARAVLWALLQAGCPKVRLANRSPARAEALARGKRRVVPERPGAGPAPEGIVVHCTPLGLKPCDPLPLEPAALGRAGLVLDLVYPETALVRAARRVGVPAEDGLGLLVAQGALSFQRWTGIAPDRALLHEALRRELARRAPRSEG